jgi:hypothetical protein
MNLGCGVGGSSREAMNQDNQAIHHEEGRFSWDE